MTTEDLIKQFELPFSDFSSPIKWEGDVGFSTTKNYADGYGSLYKFGVYKQDPNNDLRNISISVSYGKETNGGISLGTGKKGIWDPLDLYFNDEFTYSESQKKFFHLGKEIQAKDILLHIEKIHKKPTKAVRGFFLRSKLWFWRKLLPSIVKIIDILLISILYLISGEKIKGDILKRYFSERFDERSNQKINKEIEFEKGKIIDFFGYEAKRWSVIFYCSFHLGIYYIFFYLKNNHYNLVSDIGKNSFLVVCYVVVSFAITESLIPKIIKTIISKTPKIFTGIAFKTLKV